MSPEIAEHPALSPREQQILAHLVQGETYQAIAHRLGLSPYTIDTYVRRLRSKTGASNRIQLAYLAFQLGLLPQPTPTAR